MVCDVQYVVGVIYNQHSDKDNDRTTAVLYPTIVIIWRGHFLRARALPARPRSKKLVIRRCTAHQALDEQWQRHALALVHCIFGYELMNLCSQ